MVDAINSALSGIQSALQAYGGAAARVARAGEEASEGPDVESAEKGDRVELSQEAVNLIASKHAVAANSAVIRAQDRMLGNLIDILA